MSIYQGSCHCGGVRFEVEGEIEDVVVCESCGISPFRHSRSEPELFDINLRCLEGVDIDSIPIGTFDGQNWEEAVKG
jgi:hypothetical protein